MDPILPAQTYAPTYALGVNPPVGSTLSPTGITTGNMQTNETATAILAGSVNAPTTTTLSTSSNPSTAGQPVTFTAAVSGGGTPTGSATFTVDGVAQAPVPLSSGAAIFTTSQLSAGTHTITASYSGDAYHAPSSSSTLTQTVNQVPTTTALTQNVGQAATSTAVTSSADPSVFGQPITFTAAGTATFAAAGLAVGAHTITATYSGDTDYTTSTSSALTQTVNSTNSPI